MSFSEKNIPKIQTIKGVVQNYSWGGKHFIPDLLNINNKENIPFAEFWLGSHHQASSIIDNISISLNELITRFPKQLLSENVAKQFNNQLPYLLKILDVKQMLSIQVHPTKIAAKRGFEKENRKQIPIDSPTRNYKDKNHKPELIVALNDFWLIYGFKSVNKLIEIFEKIPEFSFIVSHLKKNNSHKLLYQYLMKMSQQEVDKILSKLLSRIVPLYKKGFIDKSNPDFWASKAALTLPPSFGRYDRGIFSIYLFNLVKLHKGEAVFQESGTPHAYLEGVGIEIMANSNNVLRGGLTQKHIDINELLTNIVFAPVNYKILVGKKISETEKVYETPWPDFLLSEVTVNENFIHNTKSEHSLDILIALEGKNIVVKSTSENILINKGKSFMVKAREFYSISSNEPAVLFRARVPTKI